MNVKKKFLCLCFCFVLLFMLGACSKAEEGEPGGETGSMTDTASSDEQAGKKEGGNKGNASENDEKEDEVRQEEDENGDLIEIKEKLFLQKINDIYFSYQDYKDARIAVEGIFSYFENFDASETRPVVYRYGPGCCGNDGWGGFFLKYDGDFPEENDWIRVVGRPVLVKSEEGWVDLFLKVESLEVKEERGAEYVTH